MSAERTRTAVPVPRTDNPYAVIHLCDDRQEAINAADQEWPWKRCIVIEVTYAKQLIGRDIRSAARYAVVWQREGRVSS